MMTHSQLVVSDRDSFLPSAVQRYHQLFMPALQLVSGLLISLGPKHVTAANHVGALTLGPDGDVN